MEPIGKLLFAAGIALALLGVFLWLGGGRWFGWLGRLPGDIHVEGQRGSFHFPVVTCIVVSLVLSGLLALFRRLSGQ